ncbi:MAG TPA: endonuclease/exonuclease/phosphatase family protein [Thermoanaerobaculia bacterium]|nr:endonuclease/exonuclease/phosphatase family protein [Thermoanaerobaculia bacterium]
MRIVALAISLLLAGCGSQPAPAEEASLRVMSFNIRFDNPGDGENAWPHRRDVVASQIRSHGADLVGVQEALEHQLADLEALIPDFARFGSGRTAELGGEFSAILYRTSRFELLDHGTFWLSETPEMPGSRGWDAAYERIVTWGRLRDRRSGRRLLHFNTHFDHVGERARVESARLLQRRIDAIAGPSDPVVLTGDFNTQPGSHPYRILTASLADALEVSRTPHQGPTSTWNAFRAIEPERRIDFIFVRGPIEVLRHAILGETFEGRFSSDHLPVIAEIRVSDE